MADLEDMALKKDRGYLVRLVLFLALGVLAAVFVFRGLTGAETTGCLARTIGGEEDGQEESPATPTQP